MYLDEVGGQWGGGIACRSATSFGDAWPGGRMGWGRDLGEEEGGNMGGDEREAEGANMGGGRDMGEAEEGGMSGGGKEA